MIYDMVFEGGGAKGMVFVGAMKEFEARGHKCGRLLGTSAGAIVAVALAAGYSADELLTTLSEKEGDQPIFATFMGAPPKIEKDAIRDSATFATLQKINIPWLLDRIEDKADYWLTETLMNKFPNLFSLLERGGWYSADHFLKWLSKKLDEGIFKGMPRNFSNMTLQQFYIATQCELSLITSDTTGGHMLILNHESAPDLPVVWAVRMSMSLPLVWPEVEWKKEWGTYLGKNLTGHLMIDGGMLSNFPMELFFSNEDYYVQIMGDEKNRVLGLLIDETKEVEGAQAQAAVEDEGFDLGQLQMIKRFKRFVDTATGAHDKAVIEAYDKFVVHLPAQGYGTTEFDMSDERRDALVAAGQRTMGEYLDYRDEAAFSIEDEPYYEIDVIEHANQTASKIFNW